ncbi:MAG: polysaccharide deacetylase family protein [Christensenellaceae bacterium]|jgi:peptidoglycan/xylan/chitin deacetylase (PgdA/CDA1 family)|nr:polysaccharide deacetylase family protein [Christensenellaceae bacterium]
MVKLKSESFIVHFCANCVIVLIVLALFFASSYSHIYSSGELNKNIYYTGNTNSQAITLAIMVCDGSEDVATALRIFNAKQVKTTFFITGSWASVNSEMVHQIFSDGHEIGSVGFGNLKHATISLQYYLDEIIVTERIIEKICGTKPSLYSPPNGSVDDCLLRATAECGYKIIIGSKNITDRQSTNLNAIYANATNDVQRGDIILFRPNAQNVSVITSVLTSYLNAGFNITTISKTIGSDSGSQAVYKGLLNSSMLLF